MKPPGGLKILGSTFELIELIADAFEKLFTLIVRVGVFFTFDACVVVCVVYSA